MIPSTSSQLHPSRRATAATLASWSQSITSASKSAVKRAPDAGPRNRHLPHAMLGTPHPGHLSDHDGPVLTRIQMAPSPLPGAITRRVLATGRAPLHGRLARHADLHLASLKPQFHIVDPPGLLDPQDPGVEVLVSHPPNIPPDLSHPHLLPTRFPEAPKKTLGPAAPERRAEHHPELMAAVAEWGPRLGGRPTCAALGVAPARY